MVQSVTPMPGAWDDDWSPTFDGSQVVRSDLQGNALGAVLGMEGVMITAEDATRLIPTTQESKRNDPNFARGGAVGERTGLRGKVLVVQGASEARFFEGSKNFDITDTQINSAGRDVNINSDVTANYFEDRSLSMIPYAEGAGIDTTKACLDGTRTAILAKVEDWLTATDIATPRVLWISGPAGTGKSAIAHTVARRWIIDKKGIGSCFCFNRQVVNRHQKLFSTIARDLAGRMPWLKAYLINLIAAEPALASTPDVTQQWQKLIEIPITSFAESITGPVTFVIDALDETGDGPSRRHILSILKKDVANLPSNFRILVTSRPLRDIIEAFCGASGIQHESMDQISRLSTECDIQFYISHQLQDISHDIDHQMLAQLTQKACGLFEWARLACEYIRYTGDFLTRREQCQQLIVHTGEGSVLLDDMYKVILQHIMGNHPKKVALSRFCSVLCLVLSTREPLPMESLDVLHKHMQKGHDCYGVATVLQHFGSLLSGISNQSMAICVLHSTFYEFLTSKDRSGIFWVDLVDVNLALGYACLEVMQQHLCFNICKLESSYVCNSEVIDLGQCINDHIKPYLSYSCHFWADHITLTPYQESLAGKVSAFLLNEKMLFWFEVLGLLNWTNIVPTMLADIASWIQGNNHDTLAAARDGIKFSRMIGGMISKSTPHLYLSGLAFVPKSSILSKYLTQNFTKVPRLVPGKVIEWSPLQLLIRGHTMMVNSVAFSPDGRRIASGSSDNTVCIWDAETGVQVGSHLRGHTDWVKSVAFSPDGKKVVSGSSDNTMCIWDVESGLQVGNPLTGHTDHVNSVAFSPDGKRIVSGSSDNTICIWDSETGMQVGNPLEGHTNHVNSVALSPDGKRIASGSSDITLCVWDAETGMQVGSPLEGHTNIVNSVAFSPDGKRIASGSWDNTICIWDSENGVQVGSPLKGHTQCVNSVAFSPDGKRIASGSNDNTVCSWDAETGVQVGGPLEGHSWVVKSVAFSPDGKRIVSGSIDKTICIWDAETRVQVGSSLKGHTNFVKSVAFSPDGKRIATGSFDNTVCIWDSETGVQVGSPLEGHTNWVTSVAFSPDGNRIASGSVDNTICIWDTKIGVQVGSHLKGHTNHVNSVAFSPDGKRIASGSNDNTICIWDSESRVQVGGPLKGHTKMVNSVAFSPDGKRIVSGSNDNTVCIWDSETKAQVGSPLEGHMDLVSSVAFSPDGKRFASGSFDNTICIWDAETGVQVGSPLKGHANFVNSVAFSPDGKRIASGSFDNTVCIWDTEIGVQVGSPLKGHSLTVSSVAFSPDGKRIASSSWDNTICIWDAETGVQVDRPLEGHTNWVDSVGFSPNKERIASGSNDNTICIWDTQADAGGQVYSLKRRFNTAHIIKFAYAMKHALQNPAQLFENTPEFQQDWRSHISLNSDGWITGAQGHLLIWMPPPYRKPLLLPKMQVIVPQPVVELDLSMMVHGSTWDKCYVG